MLQENETAENAFGRLLPAHSNCSAYHARLQVMLKAQQKLKAISDARKSDVADEKPSRELENDPQLLGEAKSAMQDVHDMKDKSDDVTLDDRVKMLNDDHMAVRSALVDHMVSIPAVFEGNVDGYLAQTNMNRSGTWENTEEVLGLSHSLNTPVYSYIPSTHNRVRICLNTVDPTLFTLVTQKSIYMINQRYDDNEGMHFEVIISTLP